MVLNEESIAVEPAHISSNDIRMHKVADPIGRSMECWYSEAMAYSAYDRNEIRRHIIEHRLEPAKKELETDGAFFYVLLEKNIRQ